MTKVIIFLSRGKLLRKGLDVNMLEWVLSELLAGDPATGGHPVSSARVGPKGGCQEARRQDRLQEAETSSPGARGRPS